MRFTVKALIAFLSVSSCFSGAHSAEIKVLDGSPTVIGVFGTLVSSDAEKFINSIGPLSEGVVVLHSDGGSALAGVVIGQAIRQKGFATYVPNDSLCASACALAWLGGTRRLMSKSARIGFHAAYSVSGSGQKSESGQANAIIGAYLNSLGLPLKAIGYIASAGPDQMRWLNATDAQKFGIEAQYFDLGSRSPSAGASGSRRQEPHQKAAPTIGSKPVRVAEYGNWGVYAAETARGRVCYSLSALAIDRAAGYMFVSLRPADGVRNEVSFIAGQRVDGVTASLFVGSQSYELVGKGDSLWLKRPSDDRSVIRDLEAARQARIEGYRIDGRRMSIPISGVGMTKALSHAQSLCP